MRQNGTGEGAMNRSPLGARASEPASVRRWLGPVRSMPLLLLPFALAGCGTVVLHPSGYIALLERNLVIETTLLMLLIIVPVIAFTLIFAWHYREQNSEAVYDPEWHHSTQLEVLIWSIPLAIIVAIGAITWLNTHTLDPYRPLARVDAARPVGSDPLNVEVVALDWKWLFFYPDQGIATVNELAAPVNVPIEFKLTSAAVMNSFFIPALAGQIYMMAGMQTQLHAVINKPGDYKGFSANFSGPGFSYMDFTFHGMTPAAFEQWVAKVKARGVALDRAGYLELAKPSMRAPVQYFSRVEKGLFEAILNMCVVPGMMCESEMNRIDTMGGAGKESRAGEAISAPASPHGHAVPGAPSH